MRSRWNEAQARAFVARYAALGIGEDLALRTYSARLLGADASLVLHGGGNTSVKTRARDLAGEEVEVLHVKGSGWDLASIEPAGHPAVRLAPLLGLRALSSLSDQAMVGLQRQNLLDPAAANPSVETLLHAFIPARFIDHTHAQAVLALADQPDAAAVLAEAYGDRVGIVPYVMPGFALAKAAAVVFEQKPSVHGLVLVNHGIFSFGATAHESYKRMIALVSVAEEVIERRRPRAPRRRGTPRSAPVAGAVLPVLRGALSEAAGCQWPGRWILDLRDQGEAATLAGDPGLVSLAVRGVATPDHVIRTKRTPLVLPRPQADLAAWRGAVMAALTAYTADYQAYFARHAPRFAGGKKALDPLPRLIAVADLGLVGVGADAAGAAIAADIGQSWAATLIAAEALGRFEPLGEADTFDMEYWSLEQAKLGKAAERRLARHVAVVSGGAGTIGAAIGAALAAEGAQVALLDIDAAAVQRSAGAIGPDVLALACDLTDRAAVEAAVRATCGRFGGLDIAISNAGWAPRGMIAEVADATLRASFEINFFAHQNLVRAAVAVMRAQKMGGAIVFNVSKQALNPGPDFGAYGAAKAAELALMRQYALEHGADGIRVNAVNPDRVRSGILDEEMIAARAAARGVDPGAYMAGNLLGAEVTAADVAEAVVFAVLMKKTTGAIFPVDGGNVAAMPR